MTKDDILLMAAYSGINTYKGSIEGYEENLLEFANRIAAKAAAEENEACALICDEMQLHYRAYADTALLNGNVELSIASSGEPRACEFIANTIRARHNTKKEQQ